MPRVLPGCIGRPIRNGTTAEKVSPAGPFPAKILGRAPSWPHRAWIRPKSRPQKGLCDARVNSQSPYYTRLLSCRSRFKNRPRKRSDGAMKTPADRGETTSWASPWATPLAHRRAGMDRCRRAARTRGDRRRRQGDSPAILRGTARITPRCRESGFGKSTASGARPLAGIGRGRWPPPCREPGGRGEVYGAVRGGVCPARETRHHPGGGGGTPPAALDSPVRRWERPRCQADVVRNAPGRRGHDRHLVDRAWSGSQ